MATVEKLLIKGIRSFSPDNSTVIQFERPLTLIVGHNGAGKTTIIECLKQATTGELPPNTRSGQSFIHDPKVLGETEVKAQIKLLFKSNIGAPIRVIRSFQLSQKKARLEFKTLDSTISVYDKHSSSWSSNNYRCVDIDRLVPQYMGVSKAILENVIFVHQEDSNWPLAEGQVLKKKFDDIFAATKYTKALEALRKLKLEKAQESKELKLKLATLKVHKDNATRLRDTAADGSSKVATITKEVERLETQVQEVEVQMAGLDEQLGRIAELDRQRQQVVYQHEEGARRCAALLARCAGKDLMEGAELAELTAMEEGFTGSVAHLTQQANKTEREASAHRMAVESLTEQYQRELKKHSKLAAEAEAHAANVAQRDSFVRGCARQLALELPGPETAPLSSETVQGFVSSLAARAQQVEAQLATTKQQHRAQYQNMSEAIESQNAAISRSEEVARSAQRQLHSLELKCQQLRQQKAQIAVNEELADMCKQRHDSAEAALHAKQREVAGSSLGQQLEQRKAALAQLAARVQTLRQERDRAAAANDSATRLQLKRADLLGKSQELSSEVEGNRALLLQLLGGQQQQQQQLPEPAALRSAVADALGTRAAELQARAQLLRKLQQEEASLKANLDSTRARLTQATQEEQQLQQHIAAALDPIARDQAEARRRAAAAKGRDPSSISPQQHYPTCLSTSEKDSKESVKKQSMCKAFTTVVGSYRDSILAGANCPVCTRAWANAQEQQAALQSIDNQMMNLPAQLAEAEATLARAQQHKQQLLALQPSWLRLQDLQEKTLPALRAQVSELEAQHAAAAARAGDAQDCYDVDSAELREARRAEERTVWGVDRLAREVAELRVTVSELEVAAAAVGGSRPVSDIDAELDRLERERGRLEFERNDVQDQLGRLKDAVMSASSAHSAAKLELQRAMHEVARRRQLEQQEEELQRSMRELQQSVRSAEAEQPPLVSERDRLLQERADMWRAAQEKEADTEGRVREVQRQRDQLAAVCRPVEEYLAQDRPAELAKLSASMANLTKRKEEKQQAVQQSEQQLRRLQSELADTGGLVRDVQDVLEYRRSQQQQQQLGDKLAALERDIAQVGHQPSLVQQYEGLVQQRDRLRQQQAMLRGSLATEQQGIRRCQQELAAPELQDIDARYRKRLIEQKTTEMANSDLDTYHKALEKALLHFHSSKMADINKLVKELWQKTYRGQDIDYIQIKADADAQRSYNYRVVMYNAGAELDMRGRCSAGQKVLASLVIRLALAESFCLNCGILALDEPTTNLDADNAASLAEALKALMESRRGQENFQLIVITHDEDFARRLGTRQYTELMWRVSKDERQRSMVVPEEVYG